MDWPPYSLDLNPIEHARRHLKEWVNEHHPELETLTRNEDMVKEYMIKALQEGLEALKGELFENIRFYLWRRE